MIDIRGVYTALVTPFKNGKVDYESFGRILDKQVEARVAGVIPVGTTGESPTVDFKEHGEVIAYTIEKVAGRCQVIAGTGANSTAEAIRLTKEAKELGADATLQVTPYYNKPTPEGMYRHFSTVADEVGLPVVLYNVPGRAGVPIPVDVVERLSANPNVVAVKEAAGSVDRVSQIRSRCDIAILSGDDSLTLPMMSVGAVGVVSVASNLIPTELCHMVDAALNGDFRAAADLHRKYYQLFVDLFIESNPIPVKEAMAMLGYLEPEFRLPMCRMTDAHRDKLRETLVKCEVL
ncbi:MAG: 4-hydroxy-tetrahydrodipicolinate synthase [Victivallaceae bacterium]|nr:4-hydroxy-tetrahydrodipicolinate synthase [Victivallaceae bacterium]